MELAANAFSFYFQTGSYATGVASVDGSKILFTGSTDCPGDGLYVWTLSGHTLHFTAANADPCPRSVNLNGKDWVLVHR